MNSERLAKQHVNSIKSRIFMLYQIRIIFQAFYDIDDKTKPTDDWKISHRDWSWWLKGLTLSYTYRNRFLLSLNNSVLISWKRLRNKREVCWI